MPCRDLSLPWSGRESRLICAKRVTTSSFAIENVQRARVIASQCILFHDLDRSSQVGDGLCLFNLNKRNLVGSSTKDPTVELDLVRHAVCQRVLCNGAAEQS